MNNFGVIEVASQKTKNAPGWAYVPDTGLTPAAAAALQPLNRKRAARDKANVGAPDLTARQDAKIRKDLEALDKDSHRDAQIPIPPKAGGTRAQNKHTPNVRKILQSQKTFANHLDDYQAFLALAESNPQLAAQVNKPTPTTAATTATTTARNSPAPSTITTASSNKRSSAAPKRAAATAAAAAGAKEEKGGSNKKLKTQPQPKPVAGNDDVEMTDGPEATQETMTPDSSEPFPPRPDTPTCLEPSTTATPTTTEQPKLQSYPPDGTILPAYNRPPPTPHPGDDDPLLVSRVPPFPTDEELRALITAPPLSYLEARAQWTEEEEGRYPARRFCEVCGYWGRVKCIKCGARVCALECLEAHREECLVRYGL
ncbi:uncharacterized protein B0T23DRAFT_393384 [Neurospora hispaniola]|uniref:HIT-type domain-containing protein n=1 Tax=Neurospora hispaniola TaxID=588809 RepID=A0AAJ0ICP7_9PEZI|nr:hypothetical protein B0T23DRAFT_393384 [Neurospora hispaniola]